eukprot:TRINITY_DN4121_c0_g1_i1.p1 TRINITY_DN4121_c0_g1~~TRINITY_DN4121_c0_g1_i1.p1  ORF type:complete len:600 (-),score=121.08 TRINITY_DN4121_c0_g1_i1:33-1580(-)
MCGYDGPILMTHPTKAICPILLEDFRKIAVDRKGESNFFTSAMIRNCMSKVTALNLHETIEIGGMVIKPYYAGHVLGAAMFHVTVGNQSVVYTGDFNMTPDRHLAAASIDMVKPDLLITETTYATTIRDSKRSRERDFLQQVHDCVAKGGKVLIPVFALGRAQELCILLETYWERMGLTVPIYFSAGMTERANDFYKLFINWTNQKIKQSFMTRNLFDFAHIHPFERSYAHRPGPMVLFATPGMLHAGTSLEVFKLWCGNPINMVVIPGYCVVGTVGNKLLTNGQGPLEIDKHTKVDVKCQIRYLSFSAHADAKGIMRLIRQAAPKNVVLVHGEKQKMVFLQDKIIQEFGIGCFSPANGASVTVRSEPDVPLLLSHRLLHASASAAATATSTDTPAVSAALWDDDFDASESDDDSQIPGAEGKSIKREPGAEPPAKRQRTHAHEGASSEPAAAATKAQRHRAVESVRPLAEFPLSGVLLVRDGRPLQIVSPGEALKQHNIAVGVIETTTFQDDTQ